MQDERNEEEQKRFDDLMRPLSPEEYEAHPVPTREQFREALRKGAQELREAARFKPRGRW